MTIHKVLKYYKKTNDFELLSHLNENNIDEIYYKLKKTYLKLKGGSSNYIYIDEEQYDIVQVHNLISVSNNVNNINEISNLITINYHGSLDVNKIFKIPDNVYLILPYCCGAYNYGDVLESNNKVITKEQLIKEINNLLYDNYNDEKIIKFNLNNIINYRNVHNTYINVDKTYLLYKPGQELCDINLGASFDTKLNEGIYGDNIKKYQIFNRKLIETQKVINLDYCKDKIINRIKYNYENHYNLNIDKCFCKNDIHKFNNIFRYFGYKFINEKNIYDERNIIDKICEYILNINFNDILDIYDKFISSIDDPTTILGLITKERNKLNKSLTNDILDKILIKYIELSYELLYSIFYFSVNLHDIEKEIIGEFYDYKINLKELINNIVESELNIDKEEPLIIICSSCQGIEKNEACELPICLNKINKNPIYKNMYYNIDKIEDLGIIIDYINKNIQYFGKEIEDIWKLYTDFEDNDKLYFDFFNDNKFILYNINIDIQTKKLMLKILFNYLKNENEYLYNRIIETNLKDYDQYNAYLIVAINYVINKFFSIPEINYNCIKLQKMIYNKVNPDKIPRKDYITEDSIFMIEKIDTFINIINYFITNINNLINIKSSEYYTNIYNFDVKQFANYHNIIDVIKTIIKTNSIININNDTEKILINIIIKTLNFTNYVSLSKHDLEIKLYEFMIGSYNNFITWLYSNSLTYAVNNTNYNNLCNYIVYYENKEIIPVKEDVFIDIEDIIKFFELLYYNEEKTISEKYNRDLKLISILHGFPRDSFTKKLYNNKSLFINNINIDNNVINNIINVFINYYSYINIDDNKMNYSINSTTYYHHYEKFFINIISLFMKEFVNELEKYNILINLSKELKKIITNATITYN